MSLFRSQLPLRIAPRVRSLLLLLLCAIATGSTVSFAQTRVVLSMDGGAHSLQLPPLQRPQGAAISDSMRQEMGEQNERELLIRHFAIDLDWGLPQ